MSERRRQGPVERGTRAEIKALGGVQRAPGLAAQAIEAAQAIDETSSARDKATLLNALRATVLAFREVQPSEPEVDALDQLAGRRAARRAAAAGQ